MVPSHIINFLWDLKQGVQDRRSHINGPIWTAVPLVPIPPATCQVNKKIDSPLVENVLWVKSVPCSYWENVVMWPCFHWGSTVIGDLHRKWNRRILRKLGLDHLMMCDGQWSRNSETLRLANYRYENCIVSWEQLPMGNCVCFRWGILITMP